MCGINAFGAQNCGNISVLFYTHLKLELLLHKTVPLMFFLANNVVLFILNNINSFTDVLAVVGGSLAGSKNMVSIVMENGTECLVDDIPYVLGGNIENRGFTVIEDHTIVACGGMNEDKKGKP